MFRYIHCQTLRARFHSCVLLFGRWARSQGGGHEHEMMRGDSNKRPQGTHTAQPAHTITRTHTHSKHSHTHYLCRRKKYINICNRKQYKGLGVVKYLLCLIKMWGRILVGCRIRMSSVCKMTCSSAFNKIDFLICEKIFPQHQMKNNHTPPPPRKSLFSKWKPPLESYMVKIMG